MPDYIVTLRVSSDLDYDHVVIVSDDNDCDAIMQAYNYSYNKSSTLACHPVIIIAETSVLSDN